MLSDEELLKITNGPQTPERIYRLFEAVEDLNWPNADAAAELLRKIPHLAIPIALKVVEERKLDTYFLLSSVFPYWPREQIEPLKPFLLENIQYDNEIEQRDLLALEILAKAALLTSDEVKMILDKKTEVARQGIEKFAPAEQEHFEKIEAKRVKFIFSSGDELMPYLEEIKIDYERMQPYFASKSYFNAIASLRNELGF